MKVAFIGIGSPLNIKGMMINFHERAKRLNKYSSDIQFNFYLIRFRDSLIFSKLKRGGEQNFEDTTFIDEIKYHNIWIDRTLANYLLTYKLNWDPIISSKQFVKKTVIFKDFDLLLSHGYESNFLAYQNFRINKIPYIASWHGSDINVYPFLSKNRYKLVSAIISNAVNNHFVSLRLLERSNQITLLGKKEVLYTGISELFFPYKNNIINNIRNEYKVSEKVVIGFVGNLNSIKNVLILPNIMRLLSRGKFCLWIIGDGSLRPSLEKELINQDINFRFFGKLPSQEIAKLMNAMNFLLIPSLNEGLPRVTLEALACKVHVIGTDVGGIPEVISKENCFPVNNELVQNIVNRIYKIINEGIVPEEINEKFDWSSSINQIINNINRIKY